jgi:nucleolar protein 56
LGAEKALFRALKAKQGKTPKYGLIFHSTFIGRAGIKNKGRISRYLANKCSIASRLDCFLDNPTSKFGEALKSQVEDRLKFYETGVVGQKNEEVRKLVLDELEDNEELQKEPSPKRKNEDVEMENVEEKKKSKKKSKSKGNDGEMKEEVVKSKSEKKKNEESKKKKKKEKKEGK